MPDKKSIQSKASERTNSANYLNEIIMTQTKIAQADFNLDEFMNLVVKQVEKLTPATGVVVELVEGEEMVYKAVGGSVKNYLNTRLPRGNSISGLCVQAREVLHSDDTEKDPRVNVEACRKVGARSLVVAPLFHQDECVGVLKTLSNKAEAFAEEDVKTLQLMAGLIGSALGHQITYKNTQQNLTNKTKSLTKVKKTAQKLKRMAHYDSLTELPNRTLFGDRIETAILRAKRKQQHIAVMYLDIDHFKQINDTQGHAAGDEILKIFASRLKQCVREYDTAARLGGDEFVILLDEIHHSSDVIRIAKNIIDKMRQPIQFQDKTISITTSIGIAFFGNNFEIGAADLIKQADAALYKAKESGRDAFHVYQDYLPG